MARVIYTKMKSKYQKYSNIRHIKRVESSALKMAPLWQHEYPTGTPHQFIADQILLGWKRNNQIK